MSRDLRSASLPPLRDDDHVRGAPSAPAAFFYADFSCPHCARAWAQLAPRDDLRLVFRHFALRAKHPRALPLAHAAEAAAAQGAFWPFSDSVYADQGRLDDPHLWERVRALGLDLDRFEEDRRSPAAAERVARDVADAVRAGIVETPTLVIGGLLDPGARMTGFGYR